MGLGQKLETCSGELLLLLPRLAAPLGLTCIPFTSISVGFFIPTGLTASKSDQPYLVNMLNPHNCHLIFKTIMMQRVRRHQ